MFTTLRKMQNFKKIDNTFHLWKTSAGKKNLFVKINIYNL